MGFNSGFKGLITGKRKKLPFFTILKGLNINARWSKHVALYN